MKACRKDGLPGPWAIWTKGVADKAQKMLVRQSVSGLFQIVQRGQ